MGDELPSPQMALKLLSQSGCSSRVVAHCKAVAVIAVQIAEACKKKGLKVDIKLVEVGALLHDIGRSKTHGVDHVVRGAEIARSLNLPESVASIIERHAGGGITLNEAEKLGWPVKSYLPNTLEEKIVTYADKLIEGVQRVSVERTLKKLSRELGETHSSVARVKKLHEEFSSLMADWMPTVTLLEKVYGSFSPETFEPIFSSLCKGLKVKLRVIGETNRGWVQMEVSGEDEIVALHFLDREMGLAPVSLDNLKKFSVIRGRVIFSGKSKRGLCVDIGVFSPETYDAVLPLPRLQAQLADGKKLPLQRLVKNFCLYDNLPLKVRIVQDVDFQKKTIEAELSEAQLSQITSWIRFSCDRLVVLGAFLSDVERSLKMSKHFRDVIKIESLGMLEQLILCKLGTDAVGLIPKLGRFLPDAVLVPFSPRKIRQLIDRPFL